MSNFIHPGVISVAGNLQDQAVIPCGNTVTLDFEVTDGCNIAQDSLVITVDIGELQYTDDKLDTVVLDAFVAPILATIK